jgi:prophage antirepressor-like protein
MSNEMMPFDFDGNQVRINIDDEGNPWWLAQDVCKVIGLSNVSDAVGRLEVGEKRSYHGIGKTDNALIINEPGLYRLIFRSNKPEARRFQRWVFGEILPREYGINR